MDQLELRSSQLRNQKRARAKFSAQALLGSGLLVTMGLQGWLCAAILSKQRVLSVFFTGSFKTKSTRRARLQEHRKMFGTEHLRMGVLGSWHGRGSDSCACVCLSGKGDISHTRHQLKLILSTMKGM